MEGGTVKASTGQCSIVKDSTSKSRCPLDPVLHSVTAKSQLARSWRVQDLTGSLRCRACFDSQKTPRSRLATLSLSGSPGGPLPQLRHRVEPISKGHPPYLLPSLICLDEHTRAVENPHFLPEHLTNYLHLSCKLVPPTHACVYRDSSAASPQVSCRLRERVSARRSLLPSRGLWGQHGSISRALGLRTLPTNGFLDQPFYGLNPGNHNLAILQGLILKVT